MSLFGTGRREGFLAVLLLIALAIVQHSPGLMLGRARVSATPSLAEAGEAATNGALLLPSMRQAGAAVAAGDAPTWNAHARLGEPFRVSGAPLAWPPFWLLAAWPTPLMLELLMFLHAAMACITAYRLLRVLSVSRYSAFLGAGVYGLGWFMTIALDRLPEAAAAAVLPAALELVWRCLFAPRRLPFGAGLGVAVWAMFATGGTSTAALGTGLVFTTFGFGLAFIDSEDRPAALRAVGVGATLAALLLAPLWLDSLQLRSSLRPALEPTQRHLQPIGAIGALSPGLLGEDASAIPETVRDLNPGADPLELALYPGALVLFLGLLGLMRPKRTLQSLYWIVIAAIGLMLALDGPLSAALASLFGWAPRQPGASLAILHLAVAILASLGLENFFDAPRARRFAIPVAAGAFLLLATVTIVAIVPATGLLPLFADWLTAPSGALERTATVEHLRRHFVPTGIVTIVVAGLFLAWHRLGILRFKAALATVALGELCLLAVLAVPRAPAADQEARIAQTLPSGPGRVMRFGSKTPVQPGRLAGRDGLQVIDSDGVAILDRTAHLLELVEPGIVRGHPHARVAPLTRSFSADDPLLQRAGLAVVLSDAPLFATRFTPLLASPAGDAEHGPSVFTAVDVLPRARLAFRADAVGDQSEAARRLLADSDRPLDAIVIEGAPMEFEPRRPASEPHIEWLIDRADHTRLEVDLGDGRGYLVFRDAWAPGWHATVDGESQPVLAADLAFRAVALRQGKHVVDLRYEPLGTSLGIPLAAGGLVLALMAIVLPLLRRAPKRRRPAFG